ncbi:MAG: BatA domain-containing protein [Candidatus Tectomicrobia bacterium]|nr:BatA domain-containing protein [Candidatus Tectomicrobia bacterium]
MSFQFLNPVFLWGAAAAAVPVLVHLIHRRRTRTIRFAMLDFILQSQKRKARRFRLKEWILLAIRTATVLALVGLGAQPVLTQAADTGGRSAPSHLLVVLDTSMSMRFADEQGVRFDLAKGWLRGLLSPLRGTNIAVLTTDAEEAAPAGVRSGFTPGPEETLRVLDSLRPTYGEADVLGAFQRAFGLLRTVPGGQGAGKEILFLTDGAANGWGAFSVARLKTVDPDVRVRLLRWGRKKGDANVSVSGVGLAGQYALRGLPAALWARVRNYGAEARVLPVELWAGGGGGRKLEERTVRVPAGGEAEVSFKTQFAEPGFRPGKVQVRSEGLTADDAFHFALFVRDGPRVLLVDGDPKTSLLGGETFYLMNALAPRRGLEASPFRTRWIPAAALKQGDLAETDVLVLANVERLSFGLRDAVAEYVRGGGGLLWFVGDRVSPERHDSLLRPAGLLPARMLDVREAPGPGEEVGVLQTRHPALRVFAGLGEGVFGGSRFRRYVGLAETPGSAVLMRLRGGSPLLVESALGKGRVMLFASTADRDWNDFSIRAGYLPFLHNLFLYLGCRACPGGEMPEAFGDRVAVGQAWALRADISLAGKPLTVRGPGGLEQTLRFAVGRGKEAGAASARWRAAGETGVYRAEHEGGAVLFSVNPPPAESDLSPLPDADLRAKFGSLALDALWREDLPETYNPWRQSRTDFTAAILWVLLGLVAAEVVAAGRP